MMENELMENMRNLCKMSGVKLAYVYSFLAAILIGIHIFSIKYLRMRADSAGLYMFYSLAAASFSLWCLSRGFAYCAAGSLPITNIHMVLNLSVIVSTLMSVIMLKTRVNWALFFAGVLCMLGGVYVVNRSIQ